jgi:capsular polysaccharide biosynthesis protein
LKLKGFLASVRLYWKTFAVAAGLVLAVGLSWVLLAPTKFVSTTQLMVSIEGSTTATAYQNDDVVTGRVDSYIALLTSDVVSQRVIDRLGLPLTAPELAREISATNVPPRTAVIDVAVTAQSPAQARLLAETLATEFVNYTAALETPTGQDSQKVHTTIITGASAPQAQSFGPILLTVLAAVIALVLGAVAVWVRALTDPIIRTADRAGAAAAVPVLGCVISAPIATDIEGYRRLRTRLRSMTGPIREVGSRGQVWVCTSTVGEVDTGHVASNLGRATQLTGKRSIILNACAADVEVASNETRPTSESSRGEDSKMGSDELPQRDLAQLSIERGVDGFPDTLSMSAWAEDPDWAVTLAASAVFDQLRSKYMQVVVAAPPVLTSSTTSVMSDYADGILVVIDLATTKKRDLSRAADNLRAAGAPVTGVVVAEVEPAAEIDSSNADRARSDPADMAHALTSDRVR